MSSTSLLRSARPLLVLAGCLAFLLLATALPSPIGAVMLGAAGVAFAVVVVLVTALGVAVTAVLPPLRPVAEVSILGRRSTDATKWGLAACALFGATLLSAFAGSVFDRTVEQDGGAELVRQLGHMLGTAVSSGLIVYWMWLAVDLLRCGRRRRRGAVAFLSRRVSRAWGDDAAALVRLAGRLVVGGTGEIVAAFFCTILFVITAIALAPELLTRLGAG